MESDEKPAVEALQGRLNSLNIEDGKKYLYNGFKIAFKHVYFYLDKIECQINQMNVS
jgi:hypothetical protein